MFAAMLGCMFEAFSRKQDIITARTIFCFFRMDARTSHVNIEDFFLLNEEQISKSKCQKAHFSEHSWKLRCSKSARRCGVKQTSKSKWSKYLRFGALLPVQTFKMCALVARNIFRRELAKNTTRWDHFWRLRCRKSLRSWDARHMWKSKC